MTEAGETPAPPARWARVRPAVNLLVWDVVLPLGVMVFVIYQLFPDLIGHLDTKVATSSQLFPTDGAGTVWFWWWVQQATTQGRDVLWPDVVCAPGHQALGGNFPNRIDALFALPFFELFTFPRSFNLSVLAIPVAGAMSGYWCLRTQTTRRSIALVAAILYGFNPYSFSELLSGRPVTALIVELPLFVACWGLALKAERRAWGWAILAGIWGALSVHHYVPFAIFLLLLGLAMAVVALFFPAPKVRRIRPFWVGLITVIIGIWLSLPYLHEVMVARAAGPVASLGWQGKAAQGLWDRAMYTDLWEMIQRLRAINTLPMSFNKSIYDRVQEQSFPWYYLWKMSAGETGRRAHLSMAALGSCVGLGLLGRRAGWGWLGGAIFCWILTLGPYVSDWVERDRLVYIKWAGQKVVLPMAWILHAAPWTESFLRPYRAFPLLLLCLCAAGVVGADRVMGALESRLKKPFLYRSAGVFAAALLLSANFHDMQAGQWMQLDITAWTPSPFITQMAADPEDYAIVELPEGLGHASALLQVVHQKRRAEGHHDEVPRLREGRTAPTDCFTLSFLQSLWFLGAPGVSPESLPGLQAAAIAEAQAAGFRYVVLYPSLYKYYAQEGITRNKDEVLQALQARLGAPIFKDDTLIAFKLPSP